MEEKKEVSSGPASTDSSSTQREEGRQRKLDVSKTCILWIPQRLALVRGEQSNAPGREENKEEEHGVKEQRTDEQEASNLPRAGYLDGS
jgi:hypothetical protein